MAHAMKPYLFCLLMLALYLVHTTNGVCFQLHWDMKIYNGLADPLVIYPTSKDGEDLGPHNLSPNDGFEWEFCEKPAGSTHWYSIFYWQPRQQNFTVFDDHIRHECFKRRLAEECYWMAREDGVYMNAFDDPYPKGWVKKYDW
ncbi:hypothetical protein QVD17_14599 [Tagetes erecta]|uniref:S-protein homolog n=1 Tax=Tagetes erecta TaxID=13708 RepID=A0AAD8L4T0_TARER|nr:hypothetical protein QVD17_14599 [Tagetes erecta]